jgi:hypothetical protein
MMELTTWEELAREDRQDLLETEKGFQLEPEHIYLAVERPRPKAEHVIDDYMAN